MNRVSRFFPFGVLNTKFKTPNIEVEVKYKKIGNKLVAPLPSILSRTLEGVAVKQVRVVGDRKYVWRGKELAVEIKLIDPDTQNQIPSSEALETLEHFKYILLDTNGNAVNDDDVQDFIVKPDGTEEPVRPFDRTEVIEVSEENWVPSTSTDEFLITSIYELFHPDKKIARLLWEEAEHRMKKDQVGLTTFSHGRGYKQYFAFLTPVIKEGKFVWLLKLTDTQIEYQHMQEIPSEVKVPIKEVPTLKTLPPIQAVVVAAKNKKNK